MAMASWPTRTSATRTLWLRRPAAIPCSTPAAATHRKLQRQLCMFRRTPCRLTLPHPRLTRLNRVSAILIRLFPVVIMRLVRAKHIQQYPPFRPSLHGTPEPSCVSGILIRLGAILPRSTSISRSRMAERLRSRSSCAVCRMCQEIFPFSMGIMPLGRQISPLVLLRDTGSCPYGPALRLHTAIGKVVPRDRLM